MSNKPAEWYKKLVDVAHTTDGQSEAMIKQAEATIKLSESCELHPFLHSFLDLNDLRNEINRNMGQNEALYATGSEEKFLVDSAFDEIIDTVVSNLEKCHNKREGFKLPKLGYIPFPDNSPFK